MEIKPDTTHVDYEAQRLNYELVRDFQKGVAAVRSKQETYLPKTPGMIYAPDEMKSTGKINQRYSAYVRRASFPGMLKLTVSSIVGICTNKDLKELKLPPEWKDVEDCATRESDSLKALQAQAVRELSQTGRFGLITDILSSEDTRPVLVPLKSEEIINWRVGVINGKKQLTLVTLLGYEEVEGSEVWEDKKLKTVIEYRLTGSGVTLRKWIQLQGEKELEWQEVDIAQPLSKRQGINSQRVDSERGSGFRLTEIPITIVTPEGLGPEPVDPPFVDLAYKLQDIYQSSANYREALAMYEPTPVFIGYTEDWIEENMTPKYLGAGASVLMPPGGDAKMLEYSGPTIANIRLAIQDDVIEAEKLASQPFEKQTSNIESGESRKEKAKAKANFIREIHQAAADLIEEALRKAARWTSKSENAVIFKVSDQLSDVEMDAASIKELRESWLTGFTTDEDAFNRLRQAGLTVHKSKDEWRDAIDQGETGAGITGSVE